METSITPKMQSLTINYNAPRAVNIGDVFYVIRLVNNNKNNFHAKCIVCNDERKLTVNGVTFDCPMCRTQERTLSVSQRVVRRVRVYSITQETSHDDWKASNCRYLKINFYHKEGHGQSYYSQDNFSFTRSIEDFAEKLNNQPIGEEYYSEDNAIFDDYKIAVAVANTLTARELKKVEQYNAANATNYVATFDAANDAKSN